MQNVDKVAKIAELVRRLAEEVSGAIEKVGGPFPKGWCQDCSRVLGKLLEDRAEYGFKLVIGRRGEHLQKTHVWLLREQLIVDITADQFELENCDPIIVTDKSEWHKGEWTHEAQELGSLEGQVEQSLYERISTHPDWTKNLEWKV
jgi:hypothetical protein